MAIPADAIPLTDLPEDAVPLPPEAGLGEGSFGERVARNYMALPELAERAGGWVGEKVGLPTAGVVTGTGLGHAASLALLPFNVAGEVARRPVEAAAGPVFEALNAMRPDVSPEGAEEPYATTGEAVPLLGRSTPASIRAATQAMGEFGAQAGGLAGGQALFRAAGMAGRSLLGRIPRPAVPPPAPVEAAPLLKMTPRVEPVPAVDPYVPQVPGKVDVPPMQQVVNQIEGDLAAIWAQRGLPKLRQAAGDLTREQGGASVMREVPQVERNLVWVNNNNYDIAHALGNKYAIPAAREALADAVRVDVAGVWDIIGRAVPSTKQSRAVGEMLTEAENLGQSPVVLALRDAGFSPDVAARLTPIFPQAGLPRGIQVPATAAPTGGPVPSFSEFHELAKRLRAAAGESGGVDAQLARRLEGRIRQGLDEMVHGTPAHEPWRSANEFFQGTYDPWMKASHTLREGMPGIVGRLGEGPARRAFDFVGALVNDGNAPALNAFLKPMSQEARRDVGAALATYVQQEGGRSAKQVAALWEGMRPEVLIEMYGLENAKLIGQYAKEMAQVPERAQGIIQGARAAKAAAAEGAQRANILQRQRIGQQQLAAQRVRIQNKEAIEYARQFNDDVSKANLVRDLDYTAAKVEWKLAVDKHQQGVSLIQRVGGIVGRVLGYMAGGWHGGHLGSQAGQAAASPRIVGRILSHPDAPAVLRSSDPALHARFAAMIRAEAARLGMLEDQVGQGPGGPQPLLPLSP